MADTSETMQDNLEAYPLRLNVAALPERRFFKMIRTLTVMVSLLSALLIVLAVFLNYLLMHLNVSVGDPGYWQFYRIDPELLVLRQIPPSKTTIPALQIMTEELLVQYLTVRNSTVWDQDIMQFNLSQEGVLAQASTSEVFSAIVAESQMIARETRGRGLVRDVHIYDLQLVHPKDSLWMAILETFDLPVTDDLQSACACSDNSAECLNCKKEKAKKRRLLKVWIRTGFFPQKERYTIRNPLGISVEKYLETPMPIREGRTYWDLAPAMMPER